MFLANILQPLIDVNEAILKFWHDTVGLGWGPSIIGLTVVIRLAILPLTFKQVRSMQALQRLQPEMKKIQERYKEDKQRMQQELMKFYQEHNFNPLGSCFPLLLQFPFFLSLFYLQRSAHFKAELHAPGSDPGFLGIPDLTKPVHGTTLVIMIVLYLATQLGSSYVSAVNIQDPTQRRLLFFLPIFFTFIVIRFPAGLLVYWITTNVWTIAQQLAVKKFLPPPEPLPATGGGGKAPSGATAPAAAGQQRKGFWARAMQAAEGRQADGATAGKRGEETTARAGASEKPAGRQKASASAKEKPAAQKQKAKAGSSDGANGSPRKTPPPASPRKKKKRSGRRR